MKYRSRNTLLAKVLSNACSMSVIQVVAAADIPYTEVKKYLQYAVERELLSYDADTRQFNYTEKGIQYLVTYRAMLEMVKVL
jgi:predicted transcriptional regulator